MKQNTNRLDWFVDNPFTFFLPPFFFPPSSSSSSILSTLDLSFVTAINWSWKKEGRKENQCEVQQKIDYQQISGRQQISPTS